MSKMYRIVRSETEYAVVSPALAVLCLIIIYSVVG